jgi:hypothetical protein
MKLQISLDQQLQTPLPEKTKTHKQTNKQTNNNNNTTTTKRSKSLQ